jgi:hypothetical protein
MNDERSEKPDHQFQFLHRLVEQNAIVAGDIVEIDTHIWAIHGSIPRDGDVLMAEFDTLDHARVALRQLSTPERAPHPPGGGRHEPGL